MELIKHKTMKIPLIKPYITESIKQRVCDVLDSGYLTEGPVTREFENKLKEYLSCNYLHAVTSATTGLEVALRALGIGSGDEVIVPAISFMSTATAVLHNNCIPKFCDVSLEDYCIDIDDLKEKISVKTKAVIIVHFTGNVCNISAIKKILKKKNIYLIEDCAQAHGSKYKNKPVGSFGDISCFSFYTTKHMTTGEGGILCYNSNKYDQTSKIFRNHGLISRDEHSMLGYNYRMNEIAALIGIEQLKKIKTINKKRINNSKYLIKKLSKINQNWFTLQKIPGYSTHTFFWAALRVLDKKNSLKKIISKLQNYGVEVRSRYQYPLYKHKVFLNLKNKVQNYKKVFLPNAEKLSGSILGLPNHHKLSRKDLDYIVSVISKI